MSGGVIAQQTNINSDQYFFVLANGQQINVSTLIGTNGYFSTIKGDTSFISSLISQNISTTSIIATNAFISSLISKNISTTSIIATNAFISSLQSANISTNNLSVSSINNIGLSSFNLANWSQYKATNNIVGNSSNLQPTGPFGIYVPLVDISTINNATIANLQVKQYKNNTDIFPTFYGGYINADNGISANSFSGNSASITAIGCVSLDAGNDITNIGVISAYGVNRPPGFNALYVQGGTVLDGGGTIHGITIGTQPVAGVNTMRIDVLPVGVNVTSATYVTIDAGGAGNFACGGALSLAGGSYIELNTANINCIDTTFPGSCVLNVDNIFPSQNGRGNLNSFDLYNCVAPTFFNASNIITIELSSCNINTSSLTTTVEFINNTIVSTPTYSNYNYGNNPIMPYVSTLKPLFMTLDLNDTNVFAGYDNIYSLNIHNTSFTDSNNALGIIPNTLVNGTCLSNQLTSSSFSNAVGDILTLQFTLSGLSLPVSYVINNEYSDINIYIPLADFELAPYTNTTLDIDVFSNFSFSSASITRTLSSFYTNNTYITQNISSTFLNVDISGYDTNNLKYKSLGDFQINSTKFLTDKIYTNYISAGNIIGGFTNVSTFSTLTTSTLNANYISSSLLYAKNIYTQTLGQPNGLIATPILVNNGLNMQQNNIFNIGSLSSIAISTGSIYANSISTNKLTVSQIENVSSITCGNISTNSLSVYQLENVSSITCGNISTNSLSVYKIESVSSLTAPIISSFNIVSRTGYYTGFVSTAVGYHDSITTGYITGSNGTLNYNSESIFPYRATANIGYQIANNNSGCWNNFNGLNANLSSINATSGNPLSTIGINGYLKGDNFVAKLLSSVTISTATITGLGAYFSSISAGSIIGGISQTNINSTIDGLGTLGYVSSSQLTSTVRGLGQIYVSSIQGSIQSDITSSITGLGTIGYVSSSQLTSTVRGLGQIYVSTPSLVSTIVGWAGIPANKNVNLYGNDILNINNLFTDVILPSHSDFVLFNGNGIQTNNITSADFTQINFNNDINLEQHYSLKDALSLQISDGTNNIIMCNDAGDGGIAKFYTTQNSFFFTTSNGNSAVIQLDYNDVCDTYFSNDTSGYFHLSNTNNTVILEGLVKIDTITSYINPNISFQQPILVDTISGLYNPNVSFQTPILVDSISPYNPDAIVTFPSGIQVDNFYSISPGLEINFNNNVFFGGHDLSGANNFSFIGTNPIYSSGTVGTDQDIIFQNSIDMSNNSIINLFTTATDYITANSNTIIGITSPLDLNYRNINNVSNISLDFLSNNSNRAIEVFSDFTIDGTLNVVNITNGLGYLDFSDNNLRNIPRIDFNYAGNNGGIGITSNPFRSGSLLYISNADFTFANQNVYNAGSYTGTNISTINISTSVITTQEIYTKNLGNNNPYAVQSIIVNNDFNMGQNNISNANTLTTSNISTINISTACLFTSSLTVSTINNSIFPLIQYGTSGIGATVNLPKKYSLAGGYSIQLTFKGTGTQALTVQSNTTSNFYIAGTGMGAGSAYWMTIGI